MDSAPWADRVPPIRLGLTVPCDGRFRQIVHQIAFRVAQYIGYSEGAAEVVARTVEEATRGALEHAWGTPYTGVELNFHRTPREMEIRIRYLTNGRGAESAGPGIEQLLRRRWRERTPLDLIQRVMTRVEFGHVDGSDVCTLALPLPREIS